MSISRQVKAEETKIPITFQGQTAIVQEQMKSIWRVD